MTRFIHRFCSAERAVQVLRDKSLFLVPPSRLNDPFEFAGMVEFECSEADRRILLDLNARSWLRMTEQQIKETEHHRDEMAKTDFYVYLMSLEIRAFLLGLYEFSGVCCFTAHANHPLLWAHYANAHQGVCLVFNNLDNECPIFEQLMPVLYVSDPPKIRLLDFYMNRRQFVADAFKLVHTKQTDWEYEKEWRYVLPSKKPLSADERTLRFSEQHLCKVILGDRISSEHRKTILTMTSGRRFPLLIYQAKVTDGSYHLSFKLIPEGFDYPDHAAWHKVPGEAQPEPFPPFVLKSSSDEIV